MFNAPSMTRCFQQPNFPSPAIKGGIKAFTDAEVIEAAKNYILETYKDYAYPVVPTNEYDHPIIPYEPEHVPWVVCKYIRVKDGRITSRWDEQWEVVVGVEWYWVSENFKDEEEKDVLLSLVVFAKEGQLFCGEIERVWSNT